ncbi:hypothetical protein ACMYR3_11085 [Ampullimonas aquatilis]|uniref:AbrB/MazE/SpoVT family DNA-binding domain-containing protein n=1 Tax=Ampullimonas aquatilis TaxID=1341549 RepID=UPI003C751D4C
MMTHVAQAAGVKVGTCVRLTAQPGRIIIETAEDVPSLAAMLATFDPKRHGGEVMALTPIGKEIL